jgi:transposase
VEDWLLQHKTPFTSDLLKTALCDLVKLNKPRERGCVLDDVLSAHRHMVLWLPPYHPAVNAIENIFWEMSSNGSDNTTSH